MSKNSDALDSMKNDIEGLLKRDNRFGPLHRLATLDDGELILQWDNAVLKPKAKANPGPYLAFMEQISDCVSDYGYCLSAEDDSTEQQRNNYLLIVPDDDIDLED